MDNTLWVSVGENCLGTDVLRRFGLNAPSTPYSSARSNFEHVLQLERSNYTGFLTEADLERGETFGNEPVTVSKTITSRSALFKQGPNIGFEFTHVDPLVPKGREDLERRVASMLEWRNDPTQKIFVYHHRGTKGFAGDVISFLREGAQEILRAYPNSRFVFFTQALVSASHQRGLRVAGTEASCVFFEVDSLLQWGGNDPDVLWARKDNDLLGVMLTQTLAGFGIATKAPPSLCA